MDRRKVYRAYTQWKATLPVEFPADKRGPLTLAGAAELYRQEYPGRCRLSLHKRLIRDYGQERMRTLPVDFLDRVLDQMMDEGLANNTIRQEICYHKAILRWCHRMTCLAWLPDRVAKLPPQTYKPSALTDGQRRIVFAALRKLSVGTLVEFVWETGCRPQEARAVRWENVCWEADEIILAEHKTAHRVGTVRRIFLTEGARRILLEVGPRESGVIFRNRNGDPFTAKAVVSAMVRLQRRLKIEGLRCYSMRHHRLQSMLNSGIAESAIAAFAGHSSTRALRFYTKPEDAMVHVVADSLTSADEVRTPQPTRKAATAGWRWARPGRLGVLVCFILPCFAFCRAWNRA